MQDYLLEEPHLLKKTAESISAFSNIFNEDSQSNDIKITSTELGASFKQYDIKNVAESIIKNPSSNFTLATGWMSNGIWNISCIKHFKSNFILYICID